MRFAIVAALFAGAVMAHGGPEMSTVYETEVKTITSCGPSVTDCPGATGTPIPEPEPEHSFPGHGYGQNDTAPLPTGAAACPSVSVKTISTSVTTVIPTVIYETIDIPCATATAIASIIPTGGYAAPSTGPSTTAPVFTAGASNVGVSIIAAAAGLVAFLA